ncbi:MAG TPA: chromate efflux transporter [Aestuariivirgaceae bacterium]|nr:chromate efflux transporter [Aestuariivirgaceae bacterium]
MRSEPDPSWGEFLRVWLKIGILSFGGPAAQIALMHRIVVDERRWMAEDKYLHALNFCMLLPGPEATQLATYAGWTLKGIRGGLLAGLLFVLPGAAVVLALAALYVAFGTVPFVAALFFGVKSAVLAIVFEALLRVARRALKGLGDWMIAVLAFIALFVFALPFPLVILVAAAFGYARVTSSPTLGPPAARYPIRATIVSAATWLALWLVPVAALWGALGGDHVFTRLAVFFSKLAVLTFGGAYAVISYMAQEVVQAEGWLTAAEMVDGLGLAETTPGPLILVIEFVGYIAGHRFAGGIPGGLIGAAISLWVTFVPCFLWIFVLAPYIDVIRGMPRLSGALAAITSAVVGVILNLSVWFGLHVLFRTVNHVRSPPVDVWLPELATLDVAALALLALSCVLLLRFHWGVPGTLLAASLAGLGLSFLP